VSWNNSNIQTFTLANNPTTFVFTNPNAGATYILIIKQAAMGSHSITWPGTVKWPGGTTPTMTTTANRYDIYTFIWDGTSYYGSFVQNFT
jgi:hypothetical protein